MAQFFQAGNATFESCFVAYCAAGGIDVNVSHAYIVAANVAVNFGALYQPRL
jgi:hypothetical protein